MGGVLGLGFYTLLMAFGSLLTHIRLNGDEGRK